MDSIEALTEIWETFFNPLVFSVCGSIFVRKTESFASYGRFQGYINFLFYFFV